jgi:hypothetical protein
MDEIGLAIFLNNGANKPILPPVGRKLEAISDGRRVVFSRDTFQEQTSNLGNLSNMTFVLNQVKAMV